MTGWSVKLSASSHRLYGCTHRGRPLIISTLTLTNYWSLKWTLKELQFLATELWLIFQLCCCLLSYVLKHDDASNWSWKRCIWLQRKCMYFFLFSAESRTFAKPPPDSSSTLDCISQNSSAGAKVAQVSKLEACAVNPTTTVFLEELPKPTPVIWYHHRAHTQSDRSRPRYLTKTSSNDCSELRVLLCFCVVMSSQQWTWAAIWIWTTLHTICGT